MQIENPIIAGIGYEEKTVPPQSIKCAYTYCDEQLDQGEGISFDDEIYCCTSCLGDELIERGHAVDVAQI